MSMYHHRVQILLDDARHARIEDEAARRKVSVATVVREAIDRAFPEASGRRRAAGARILAAQPMAVPDPDQLREELGAIRSRLA